MKWREVKTHPKIEIPKVHPDPFFVQRNLTPFVRQKSSKSWFLNCPFHPDKKTPSLSVVVDRGYEQPPGFWKCFGCGERGYWNKLAEALNLETIDGYKLDLIEEESLYYREEVEPEPTSKLVDINDLVPWPKDRGWRGFTGRTIRNYDGMLNTGNKNYPLVFLCYHRGSSKVIGFISCTGKKIKGKKSYIFSGNTWVSDYLWPEHKLPTTNKVSIVEGVRDALACICRGIPALAILGTSSGMGTKRKATLFGLGVDVTNLFMDGDVAGKKAVYGGEDIIGLRELLLEDFNVKVYKTWQKNPEKDPYRLMKSDKFVKSYKSFINMG